MFRRQQKAGSLCFWAQTVSLSLSLLLPRRGTLCARKAGGTSAQLLSAAQRYNTLDFASKVVRHETPARFLWILPVIILPAYFLPRCPLWSRRHDRLLAGRPGPAGWHDPGRAADQPPPGRSAQQAGQWWNRTDLHCQSGKYRQNRSFGRG